MSSSIGVVTQVVGTVSAVASDGSTRLLVEGDRVFLGERLVCANDGAVAIRLDQGGDLTMGRASSLLLSPAWLADQLPPEPSAEQLREVAADFRLAVVEGAHQLADAKLTQVGDEQGGASAGLVGQVLEDLGWGDHGGALYIWIIEYTDFHMY